MNKGAHYMIISSFAFSLMHLCVKAMPHIPAFELVFFRSLGSLLITFFYLNKEKTPILVTTKKCFLQEGRLEQLDFVCFL